MSFADVFQGKNEPTAGTFRKPKFISLTPGAHTIRILDSKASKYRTHYVNKVTIKCLGDGCPLCENNRQLMQAFPDSFRKQAGYSPVSDKFVVNVLDKTQAKVCESCGAEYKDLNMKVCTCGKALGDPKPLNKVKILAKGKMLFEHLETIHNSILDSNGNPVGINNYDIAIIVSGTGKDATYTPIPNPAANAPVSVEEELYDPDTAVVELTAPEILDLKRGVSLKDIFASRRKKEDSNTVEPSAEEVLPEEVIQQINTEIEKLFGTH